MNAKQESKACRFQLAGWILFIFSALFFIATSIRAGDMLGLVGGLFFLIACFVFLIPLVFPKYTEATAEKPSRN
jgi:energy-coupling factor transporter transmembrane protein EcfT